MTPYELQYAEGHERKTEIINARDSKEADRKAEAFLAGRKKVSLRSLHLPARASKLRPEFIPVYEAN